MSRSLFVKAREGQPKDGVAVVTKFSADLMKMLYETFPDAVFLNWFCGAFPERSPHAIAYDMMGQLLTQSVKSKDGGLDIPSIRIGHPGIAQDELVKLIRKQLEKTTVFCVIDSIEHYQYGINEKSMEYMLDGLRSIMPTQGESSNIFKLLVTGTYHFDHKIEPIAGQKVVEVPKTVLEWV